VAFQPRDVPLSSGGVDDDEIRLRSGAIDKEVVDYAAVVTTEEGVRRAAFGESGDIGRHQGGQPLCRGGSGNAYLPHVGDVEETCRIACCVMLGDRSGAVLYRHVPAGEIGETGAVVGVPWVKTRLSCVHSGSFWPVALSRYLRDLLSAGDHLRRGNVPRRCVTPSVSRGDRRRRDSPERARMIPIRLPESFGRRAAVSLPCTFGGGTVPRALSESAFGHFQAYVAGWSLSTLLRGPPGDDLITRNGSPRR
jgi:hypothetical protein